MPLIIDLKKQGIPIEVSIENSELLKYINNLDDSSKFLFFRELYLKENKTKIKLMSDAITKVLNCDLTNEEKKDLQAYFKRKLKEL